jgi:uncharacterized protein (TIGR00369 family)
MEIKEAKKRLESGGFHDFLGVTLEDINPGRVEIALPYHDGLARDGDGEMIHGGILASLLDIAVTYSVISEVDVGVPTVDLRTDYLRPAVSKELTVVGDVIRIGGTVAVAEAEVTQVHDGEIKVVATGRGLLSTAHVDRD